MFKEIYYTEIDFNKYEVLLINTKDNTYHISYETESELNKDSVLMSKSIFDALIIGIKESNVFKEK